MKDNTLKRDNYLLERSSAKRSAKLSGDTIYARATAPGRGGIAIIRISGPDAGALLDGLTRPRPLPRQASLRALHGADGQTLDHALVLWFVGPSSYTGEDCAELHLHAGPAVVDAVSEALQSAGARPAGPGEFTQRAFLSGRIDLVEAEGLADLIEAETDAQRQQALAQSRGALSKLYATWSLTLKRLVALQEASIDFPDETAGVAGDEVDEQVIALEAAYSTHLLEGHRGSALRRGVRIAVTGRPNVGKSSLVNALSGREVSIVSKRPGTTRDIVETRLVLSGAPVTLIDTAGLRDSEDEIELEGIRRARVAAAGADIVLRILSSGSEAPEASAGQPTIDVSNKIDVMPPVIGTLGVSVYTGEGLEDLRTALGKAVEQLTRRTSLPSLTRIRHRDCVERSLAHLRAARASPLPELRGEELRLALRELGRLTGAIGVEEILSDIFSTFCIGK